MRFNKNKTFGMDLSTPQEILEQLGTQLNLGQSVACEALLESGELLRGRLQHLPASQRLEYGEELKKLRIKLLTEYPLETDTAPMLTFVSAIPLTLDTVNWAAQYQLNGQNPAYSVALAEALAHNLIVNKTLQREADIALSGVNRLPGEATWQPTDFELDFECAVANLLEDQPKKEFSMSLIEHVFSISVECPFVNLQGEMLEAMFALGYTRLRGEAEGWSTVKNWLELNQQRVCDAILSQGWSRKFKANDLVKKAEILGFQRIANAILLRSCRQYSDSFLALRQNYGIDPDQKTYTLLLQDAAGRPVQPDGTSLTALFAHALAYGRIIDVDWMAPKNHSSSPARLLESACREVRRYGLSVDPAALKALFEQCMRNTPDGGTLDWLQKSEFSPLLKGSLAYQAARFSNDLGL